MIKVCEGNQVHMQKCILKLLEDDDLKFYERFLLDRPLEEVRLFFDEHPEFMGKYHIDQERLELLKDENYRKLLRELY